jgi:hypothetical protein
LSLKQILGSEETRVVALYPALRRVVTPLSDLIFISQILYWASVKNPFYKTNMEMSHETGLTKKEIEYIKRRLSHYEFISVTHKGVPRKTYYTVDWNILAEELGNADLLKGNASPSNSGKLEWNTKGRTATNRKFNKDNKSSVAPKCGPLDSSASIPVTPKSGTLENRASTPVAPKCGPLDDLPPVSVARKYGPLVVRKYGPLATPKYGLLDIRNCRPLYKEYTETTTKNTSNIIVANETFSESIQTSTTSSDEDKPHCEEVTEDNIGKFEYSAGFELLWSRYKPRFSKQKGSKRKAYKTYQKTKELFSDEELVQILDKYMDSTMFELGQAHLATFLNGIITDTKYRDEFVEGGFEHRLQRVRAKHDHIRKDGKTAQERYREDIAKQGELNANELIDRSSHISVILSVKHGLKMGAIEHGDRKEWLPYLGPEYVAIPIKHPMSKTDKIKVLFHIDELRSNQYVHLHGKEWSDFFEEKYQESNENVVWVDALQLPSKEEYTK